MDKINWKELYDIIIDGEKYYTDDCKNGSIYKSNYEGDDLMYDDNDDPIVVGEYQNGEPLFYD